MAKFIEQYNRMIRWYKKFESINAGRDHIQESDYYKDEGYAFFITCCHFRDWLLNDRVVKIQNKEMILKEYVDRSKYMKICHDICNGHKHLDLTSPKHNGRTKINSTHHKISLGGNAVSYKAKYFISDGRKYYDAFDVASKCIEEWETFLRQYNLI